MSDNETDFTTLAVYRELARGDTKPFDLGPDDPFRLAMIAKYGAIPARARFRVTMVENDFVLKDTQKALREKAAKEGLSAAMSNDMPVFTMELTLPYGVPAVEETIRHYLNLQTLDDLLEADANLAKKYGHLAGQGVLAAFRPATEEEASLLEMASAMTPQGLLNMIAEAAAAGGKDLGDVVPEDVMDRLREMAESLDDDAGDIEGAAV